MTDRRRFFLRALSAVLGMVAAKTGLNLLPTTPQLRPMVFRTAVFDGDGKPLPYTMDHLARYRRMVGPQMDLVLKDGAIVGFDVLDDPR